MQQASGGATGALTVAPRAIRYFGNATVVKVSEITRHRPCRLTAIHVYLCVRSVLLSITSATLYWTAVINGVLAPFLLVGILIAASDRQLMHDQPSPWLGRVVVGLTTAAAIGMFVF